MMTTRSRRANREGERPTKRADGRWTARIAWTDANGKPQRKQVYGKSSAEVRAKVKDIAKRLDQGQPGVDAKVKLKDFTEVWIGGTLAASDRKPSTKSGYAILARKHVAGSELGARPLDQIKPSSVEKWLVSLRAKGLSESTVRQVYTVLRAVLDTAVRDGLVGTNAAAIVKRPKVTHHEARFLSADEVKALLDAASGSRYGIVFELLAGSGLRRGEALALTWRDIDFEQRRLHVRGTLARIDDSLVVSEPKSAKSRRVIPMTRRAEHALRAAQARQRTERLAAGSKWNQTGFVFTTPFGEPCDPRNALRALEAAAKRVGLEGIGLHTLRHSAATLMLGGGESLATVSRMLGHASIAITVDTYGHVAPDVARCAMDKLDEALG